MTGHIEGVDRNKPEPLDVMGRGPRVVLVGVDETLSAQRATSYAAGLAVQSEALLIAVHSRPMQIPAWSGFSLWCPLSDDTAYGSAVFHSALSSLPTASLRMETLLRMGDPVRQLCDVARARWADLIVVGSPRSLRHRVAGSVPSRLLAQHVSSSSRSLRAEQRACPTQVMITTDLATRSACRARTEVLELPQVLRNWV